MGQTAAKMAMAGQLEVTPPELQFAVKVGEYSKRQMRLNNLGTQAIAFKIKTTNPKQYFVKPNQGVVQPKERAIIQVMMGKLPQLPADKCKDKFLVQTIPYEGNHTEGDVYSSWTITRASLPHRLLVVANHRNQQLQHKSSNRGNPQTHHQRHQQFNAQLLKNKKCLHQHPNTRIPCT